MQNINSILFAAATFLCVSPAHAKPTFERLLECKVGDINLGIFSSAEMPAPNVAVYETRNGKHRAVPGRLTVDQVNKTFELKLPSYWDIKSVGPEDCATHGLFKAAFQTQIIVHRLKVDTHFISGHPRPDVDLEKLLKTGEAFPVRLTVNCFAKSDAELSVSSCLKIQILESRIDLPPPTRGGDSASL